MNRIRLTASAIILAAAAAVSIASATADRPGDATVNTLVRGNSAFAVLLYRELGASEGNLFFSPYSVSSALAMAYAGARENTAKEMKETLRFQLDEPQLHSAFKQLNQELAANAHKAGQKVNIANGLCLTGGDVSKEFKAVLKENYDAELFAGGLDRINGWVERKTEGKIDKILDTIDPNSACVLLNAVYFKGAWEHRFKDDQTHEAPFRLSSKEEVEARLMYQKRSCQLLTKEDFQAISMPYKGGRMSMILLLPEDVDGLAELEKQLTAETLTQWMAELDKTPAQETELFLPKFKMETGYDLVPPFRALGMRDAFDTGGKADFRGMGWPKGELWISQIQHKAFVEVNEEGTEAAAATAVEMQLTSARYYPVFRADHPFIFVIRDNASGGILFMGRVADPRGNRK
ncbi:serpin family protein [Desulfococcus sp.]|uniref:serpin family protein n=1 Tax=Desulfococcus sp. TaxID=2025834 RepID=UPI00359345DB